MSYQIIARKYRPRNFEEIIGQDKILLILRHAIDRMQVGQSYLFSGPRGVGKTTLARILVKCLNCEKGISHHPCDQCDSCRGIQDGVSLDYEEIDAASNRGIDNIRELKNNLIYGSAQGKYKVYVIDEVHMLTQEAFNALLKSLEEPPEKTVFILCTTEKHKIPMTIRSRCQQFAFNRVSTELIASHLGKILKQEKILYEEESLFPIARKADGSVRDAENLMEQAISYANQQEGLTKDSVIEILGELSINKKLLFVNNLLEGKLKENQFLVHELSIEGFNFEQFLFDINEIFNVLIYMKNGVTDASLMDIARDDWELITALVDKFEISQLFMLSDLIYNFIQEYKNTTFERLSIYFFLHKLHRYKSLISNQELKENITYLAKNYLAEDEKIHPQHPQHPQHPIGTETTLKPDEINTDLISETTKNLQNNSDQSLLKNEQPNSEKLDSSKSNAVEFTPENEEDFQVWLTQLSELGKDNGVIVQELIKLLNNFKFSLLQDGVLELINQNNLQQERLTELKSELLEQFKKLTFPSGMVHSLIIGNVTFKESAFLHNSRLIKEQLVDQSSE